MAPLPPDLPALARLTILVAEDDATIRTVVAATLTDAGFWVKEARNGREALTLVLAESVDLVLTDYDMPGLDGVELCRELRRHPTTHALPVVLMSAGRNASVTREAHADGFLAKPFSLDQLEAIVRQALRLA